MSRVRNVSDHVVDLSDGRMLGPLDEADKVDTQHPHQRGLIADRKLIVVEGTKPRRRGTPQEVVEAAEAVHEDKEADRG